MLLKWLVGNKSVICFLRTTVKIKIHWNTVSLPLYIMLSGLMLNEYTLSIDQRIIAKLWILFWVNWRKVVIKTKNKLEPNI